MRMFASLILSLGLIAGSASAQLAQTGAGLGTPVIGAAYSGPGDVLSSAKFACSVFAYNAAYATGSNPAMTVTRASDSATQVLNILSSGSLDVATAATFAGTNVSGTGSITGTAMTLTGGIVGGQVTGSGVTPGTFINSGTSPNWSVNISQTVGSTTLSVTNGMYVTTCNDQSGSSNNAVQSTTNNKMVLVLNTLNGGTLPAMAAFPSRFAATATNIVTTAVLGNSISAVAERTGNTGAFNGVAQFGTSNPNVDNLYFNSSANTAILYAGSVPSSAAANDNVLHSLVGGFNNASSVLNVDGSETTLSPGAGVPPNPSFISVGSDTTGNNLQGFVGEVVVYPAHVFTPTERTNLCHVNRVRFGTSGAC